MATAASNLLPQDVREHIDRLFPFGLASLLDEIIYEDLHYVWGDLPTELAFEQIDEPVDDPDAPPSKNLFMAEPAVDETEQLWLDFHFRGSLTQTLGVAFPSIAGVELVLGAGRIGIDAEVDLVAGTFQTWMGGDVLTMRFSRDLLVPVVAGPNGFSDDPRPNAQVEVRLYLRIGIDESGAIFFEWPENAPDFIQLPNCRIAGTEYTIVKGKLRMDFSGDERGIAVQWEESQMVKFLGKLSPTLGHREGDIPESTITGRVLLGQTDPIREVRLDWSLKNSRFTFGLPGLDLKTPSDVMYSLLLGGGGRPLNFATLLMSLTSVLPPDQPALTLTSNFAWGRDGARELQSNSTSTTTPFVTIEISNTETLSLALLDIDLSLDELPSFFQELLTPLTPLNFEKPDTLFEPTPAELIGLQSHWTGKIKLNTDAFRMPFLEQEQDQADANQFKQWVQIKPHNDQTEINIDFEQKEIALPFDISVQFGPVQFTGNVVFRFNWETMSLAVDHGQGISLATDQASYTPDEAHLGLYWTLRGAPLGNNRYEYFRLVTKDYNYQVQMAQNATFELEFREISDEPIVFIMSDFVLSPKGLNLTARVSDQPVRLNGIGTRFRFNNSGFKIVENQITDFTLAGSGPLPPDLVGDAVVDIALQFKQVNGVLTLVAGGAQLKGNKLLDCKSTRFQFSVDALGMKFVNDGKFHLYFTLSGSAQFVLAPGDDKNNALALLPKIRIDLLECPLAGDVRVIAKHVKFLIELPKPKSFSFLGAFDMELRAIGFLPSADEFDGDAAMHLAGKLKFVQGVGDTPDDRVDYHELLIGLPAPGEFFPRIHFKQLSVNINLGAAFKLNGVVEFRRTPQEQGFLGEGTLEIQGLPTFAAAFAFLRIRRDEQSPWVRAWFIYLEVRKISFRIPVVELYIREVGLGFGYRYTLVSIKAADRANDVRKLLKELQALSRTQGDLSKRDRWAIDFEDPGQDPRWTVVLRALISQTSASVSPLSYDQSKEAELPCVFLFDAIIAFRSDFTFLMAVRLWLNTNYNDYVIDRNGARSSALLTGFVLLSARQKRLLANVSSNPNGKLGEHPPLPDFVKKAIQSAQFTMTLLIEPGLLHYELGWPNMLRWTAKLGPLDAEFQGGFIFRVSKRELVTGTSFLARASLAISGSVDLGLVGVRVSANARIAFGARYIGVISFDDPIHKSALYGAIGLEANIQFSIAFWIKIPLVFTDITLRFSFSLAIGFTAGLEIGIDGLDPTAIGLRGTGTLSVSAMGHSLEVSIKLAVNEGAVENAFKRTNQFLQIGLEATDVESVPGVPTSGVRALPASPAELLRLRPLIRARGDFAQGGLSAPDYSVFVVRRAAGSNPDEGWTYFVLLPRAEREVAEQNSEDETDTSVSIYREQGFLPTPPRDTLAATLDSVDNWKDFTLTIPQAADGEQWTIEQFNPRAQAGQQPWQTVASSDRAAEVAHSWRVNWNQPIASGSQYRVDDTTRTVIKEAPTPVSLSLRDYLVHAYLTEPGKPASDPKQQKRNAVSDPDPLPDSEVVEDVRVHNPTDNAFESAVRGAWEQFRGSPFFKHDLNSEYERALTAAFKDDTTIYSPKGTNDLEPEEYVAMQQNQQARQLRGMIVHDLIADVREYAASPVDTPPATHDKLPFQMGLVFRVKGRQLPAWLDQVSSNGHKIVNPQIRQRIDQDTPTPNGEARAVRTFNVAHTDFAINAPQFQQVRQFTDANTIALTWNLVWSADQCRGCVGAQADPEHHLMHYVVRRRALAGDEREVVTTVKPTHALHREPEEGQNLLKRLRPRFQIVDHFNQETQDDLAALPAEGRSYLYTITPIDFAGHAGRPLTLVATRFPNQPPQVPANGELIVIYRVRPEDLSVTNAPKPQGVPQAAVPQIVRPYRVHVEWPRSASSSTGPYIAVEKYVLIFRREPTLPIGSYGLDSATQRPRYKSLPTSNARPLPTDIRIEIESGTLKTIRRPGTDQPIQIAELLHEALQGQDAVDLLSPRGILPPGGTWQPEAWRVFVQAIARNSVPSALAPVQLLLRVEVDPDAIVDPDAPQPEPEERRPAELEWLPRPQMLPLLLPEDQRAATGEVHVPMPAISSTNEAPRFEGHLGAITFEEHPAALRMIRFRWNQAPSTQPDYPLHLNAGFHLLQLDIDAHTTATFAGATQLADALRFIQELQMLPGEDLQLVPGDTLVTNQWEAWYPSAILRRHRQQQRQPDDQTQGSQSTQTPWFSWRESYLEWPAWPDLTDGNGPKTALHPLLDAMIAHLDTTYTVDVQARPPLQPGTLASFQQATAAKNDPYGWAILQRLGLSVTFSLRREALAGTQNGSQSVEQAGQLIPGAELLAALNTTLTALFATDLAQFKPYLHVELLVQPGRSTRLPQEQGPLSSTDLLGLVQISLRPMVRQYLRYAKLVVTGLPNAKFDLVWTLDKANECSLINQTDLAAGQIELVPQQGAAEQKQRFRRLITLPLNGETTLLVRTLNLAIDQISVQAEPTEGQTELPADLHVGELTPFDATDDRSLYFTVPVPEALAPLLADPIPVSNPILPHPSQQWYRIKRYLESLNSTDKTDPQIEVPLGVDAIKAVLPATLAWLQRFFDASGGVTLAQHQTTPPDAGPWLVTAYPRAGSPAYVTPDASGRLQYDQLIEDKWAHTYRYYIRPYSRYALLWRNLRQSPLLFPDLLTRPTAAPEATPVPTTGGLDVVLDRTQPVDRPLILSSRRLDPPSIPGAPVPPGPTWEVIIAQHPEQQLIERNQTLVRQLAFRHVAFTLLRRFAYGAWIGQIEQASSVPNADREAEHPTITIRPIADSVPALPAKYPDHPDHVQALVRSADGTITDAEELPLWRLKTSGTALLDDAAARSLDLPERLGAFRQGALVLQWDGLPFFYEHRLLTVAHTASTVSTVNEVVQRDFEYRSPEPSAAIMGVLRLDGGEPTEERTRRVQIPLRRLWDALPLEAQRQWPAEAPDPLDSTETSRVPASLPDLEVVYQIAESWSGNIEVQAEFYFDRSQAPTGYRRRQLGQRIIASDPIVLAPPLETPQADWVLMTDLDVAAEGSAETGTVEEPITQLPAPDVRDQITDHPAVKLRSADSCALVWTGSITTQEQAALQALGGDEAFTGAVQRLIKAAGRGITREFAPSGPDQVPANLVDRVRFDTDPAAKLYTRLIWTGPLTDADEQALRQWAAFPSFAAAIDALVQKIREPVFVTLVAPRPLQSELSAALGQQLHIGDMTLSWTAPAPIAEQRAKLADLPGDAAFRTAVTQLLAALDSEPQASVELPTIARRPRQVDLPPALRDKLTIALTQLTWSSGFATNAEQAALETLRVSGDEPFQTALGTLLDQLSGPETVVACAIPLRPQPADLPPVLRDKLLIGRALISFAGLMTIDEGRALQAHFALTPDRQAIQRLYTATLSRGMRGRTILIRARRGSAHVSQAYELDPLTLDHAGEA